MNSQATEQLIEMLLYILIPIVIAIFILIGFLVYLHFKEKKPKKDKIVEATNPNSAESATSSNKQSIFNFMEFDNVEDNMIIQKNGSRFFNSFPEKGELAGTFLSQLVKKDSLPGVVVWCSLECSSLL